MKTRKLFSPDHFVHEIVRVGEVLNHSCLMSDSDLAQEAYVLEHVCVFTQPGPIADLAPTQCVMDASK